MYLATALPEAWSVQLGDEPATGLAPIISPLFQSYHAERTSNRVGYP